MLDYYPESAMKYIKLLGKLGNLNFIAYSVITYKN